MHILLYAYLWLAAQNKLPLLHPYSPSLRAALLGYEMTRVRAWNDQAFTYETMGVQKT
jgi:hypothetical protein